MKKMSDYEEDIIRQRHGRDARPILIEDKSIEGLIRANLRPWSMGKLLHAYKFLLP